MLTKTHTPLHTSKTEAKVIKKGFQSGDSHLHLFYKLFIINVDNIFQI